MNPAPKALPATQALTPGCQACGLCTTQSPLLAPLVASQVICVGLSSKVQSFPDEQPLDERTNSGFVITLIEKLCNMRFYKTNLVKCAPLTNGKLRYPTSDEAKYCVPHLKGEIAELQPKVVLMLGKQVTKEIAALRNFTPPTFYSTTIHHGIQYISIPHPSYIWIYKRKELDDILDKIATLITKAITDAE